jgi:hypothetical protein
MRESSSAPGTPAVADRVSLVAERLGEGALLLLLLLAPLPFGAVQKGATFVLVAWAAALAWIVLPARASAVSPLANRRWTAAIALAAGFEGCCRRRPCREELCPRSLSRPPRGARRDRTRPAAAPARCGPPRLDCQKPPSLPCRLR